MIHADLIDLQRLRSERRLLESANEHLLREHASAQVEVSRLRAELSSVVATLQRILADLDRRADDGNVRSVAIARRLAGLSRESLQ